MNRVEIITLRSAGKLRNFEFISFLLQIQKEQRTRLPSAIYLYSHAELESDLSFHLHWEIRWDECQKSDFGIQLADALQEYGLVHHAFWQEMLSIDKPGKQ